MRKIFFVVGPSGSGKTTLVDYAIEKLGPEYGLKRIVSCITREPRPDEVDGESFHFITGSIFDRWTQHKNFIEYEQYDKIQHGILKYSINDVYNEKNNKINLIKEITPTGLKKIIEYNEKYKLQNEIITIGVEIPNNERIERLKKRGLSEKEVLERIKSDYETRTNIKIDRVIINSIYNINAKSEFVSFIDGNLKGEKKMINIHDGYTVVKNNNENGRFVHILVDSENEIGVVYYVTVDRWTGKLLGCSCPRGSLYPYDKCKHQKAVIEQRLLGVETVNRF